MDVHEPDNNDPSYGPGQPHTPHPGPTPLTPYTTPPHNIQHGTRISDATKERLTAASPDDQLRITRSELATLEFAWGMKFGKLDLDTTQNMMWLSPNLRAYFDAGDWAVVPSLSDLRAIQQITFAEVSYTQKTKKFTQVCPRAIRAYDFAHFKPSTEPLFHFAPSSPTTYTPHIPLYKTISPINSHVNPYFVICNVAMKDKQHRPKLGPSMKGSYETLEPDILARVRLCRAIYDIWMGQKPAAQAALKFQLNGPVPSYHPSTHTSTSQRSNPPQAAKRMRPDDPEDNQRNTGERGSPSSCGGPSGSAHGDSIDTPQDDVEDDFGSQDNWYDVMDQSCTKVQDWLMHLDSLHHHI
ncbi:hypothetical protein RSOLAG1IB_10885 [Rhizoctonia solani AG-1 IB]|uniref:HNH nuclease domain-containing protein n=1 Tax=Thanatephorus cucumeris (strain AG1-IB / isolate 7/3/14) TaxID=1108050 RepID=M5C8C2_THACB|nr:hypothetical protein BN14_09809 [Rhizoctonia solani AG-1 IB]CEL63597.1 hypothetical protein RSOLAG1IB_10885 [Rhizoctonia solani AG-1 IB]